MNFEKKINLLVGSVVILSGIVFVTIQVKDPLASLIEQMDTSCSINKLENCTNDEAMELVQGIVNELNLKTDKYYYILDK